MQVLRTNVVIGSVDTAFQEAKEAFDRVGCDANSTLVASVLISFMVHLVVLTGMDCTVQDSAAIGHNPSAVFDVVFQDGADGLRRDPLDMVRTDFPAALHHRDYGLFVVHGRREVFGAFSRFRL